VLARRAGEAGRLRFEMGRGLDLLQRSGGDHALGFSSIEAYALERCERSASWTQKARALASRLEALPVLADALVVPRPELDSFGDVRDGWSRPQGGRGGATSVILRGSPLARDDKTSHHEMQ
jgi:hypothetical protein